MVSLDAPHDRLSVALAGVLCAAGRKMTVFVNRVAG